LQLVFALALFWRKLDKRASQPGTCQRTKATKMSLDDDRNRPRLTIENDGICCDVNGRRSWICPISKIVLIAEYTTNEGPWCDDYFLVFWTWEDDRLFRSQVSFYANGRDEVIAALSRHLTSELKLDLIGSTDWKSRVIWPPQLADHPYFTFSEVLPKNWRERVRGRLLGQVQEYFASDEVCGYLRRYDADFPRQP
jgi:hypothetical protein